MESIDDTLAKRESFSHVWELLAPKAEYTNHELWSTARNYWNTLTLARQRQIYYTLREQKKRGEPIKENPLYAIQDCHPVPVNWNGRPGLNELIRSGTKMVSAKWGESYGIYTAQEAQLFEMTIHHKLN